MMSESRRGETYVIISTVSVSNAGKVCVRVKILVVEGIVVVVAVGSVSRQVQTAAASDVGPAWMLDRIDSGTLTGPQSTVSTPVLLYPVLDLVLKYCLFACLVIYSLFDI